MIQTKDIYKNIKRLLLLLFFSFVLCVVVLSAYRLAWEFGLFLLRLSWHFANSAFKGATIVIWQSSSPDRCTTTVDGLFLTPRTVSDCITVSQTNAPSSLAGLRDATTDIKSSRVKCFQFRNSNSLRPRLLFTCGLKLDPSFRRWELWLTGRADGLTACWTCADRRPFCPGSWRSGRRPGTTHHQRDPAERTDRRQGYTN